MLGNQLDRHGVVNPLHAVQRRGGVPGDDAPAPSPQPRRDRVDVDISVRVVGQVDVRVNGGVVPAQRTTRKRTARDRLGTDNWPNASDGLRDN